MERLLLVEDDAQLALQVRRALEARSFIVEIARDGATGMARALQGWPTLIVLDLMLPRIDGWEVCETLRARRVTTPILMLTARDAVDDRVRGFESGADDYLRKPFEFPELLARLRALVRRDKVHRTRVLRIADLEVDTGASRVWRSGREVRLTPREYQLLEALAINEGRVLTRDVIQERVWLDEDSSSDTVKVHVASLRRKIDAEHRVKLIHTVHGFGYLLRRPDTGGEADQETER